MKNRCASTLMRRTSILLSRLCSNDPCINHTYNYNSPLFSSLYKFIPPPCSHNNSTPPPIPNYTFLGAQGGFLFSPSPSRSSFIYSRHHVVLSPSNSLQCSFPHYYSFSRGNFCFVSLICIVYFLC